MKNPAKVSKIIGPPGTGKTTEILRLVTAACQKYFPNRIGAVSFTNAAVEEIKGRIVSTLKTSAQVATNVKTIHSHCFSLLGLGSDQVAELHIAEFNNEHPEFAVRSTIKADESAEVTGDRNATALFNEMNINRNRRVPIEKWLPDVKTIYENWTEWKERSGYVDFTQMLEVVLDEGLCPEIDVLFVDEAQDLTPLQYGITKMWSKQVSSTVYAGDSDQAIFRWSGSVPEMFIQLPNQWRKELRQSYRVPPAVHKLSSEIICQVNNREDVDFMPCIDNGTAPLYYLQGEIMDVSVPDITLPGSHMIISRCNYQVRRWINWLIDRDIPWKNTYRPEDLSWNPAKTASWRAVMQYYRLFEGETLTFPEFMDIIDRTVVSGNLERGTKKFLREEFTPKPDFSVTLNDIESLGFVEGFTDQRRPPAEVFKLDGKIALLLESCKPETVLKEPEVTVGTIHSVKGGEADWVWIDSSLPSLIHREMNRDPNVYWDECRVQYVAVTRARMGVGILKSKNRNPIL